jgi:hypothetical protein
MVVSLSKGLQMLQVMAMLRLAWGQEKEGGGAKRSLDLEELHRV